MQLGDSAGAIVQARTAHETESLSFLVHAAHAFNLARRYDEAIAECRKSPAIVEGLDRVSERRLRPASRLRIQLGVLQ